MRRMSIVAFVGLLLVASGAAMPAAGSNDGPGRADAYFTGPQLSMAFSDRLRAMAAESPPEGGMQPEVEREPSMAPPPPGKGPPLPLHNLEGTSGGCITPMAYFANPGPEGTVLAMPAASYTFLLAGSKKVHSIALSTVLWRRIELSYAWNAVDLGSFPNRVFDTGGVTIRDHIYLHNLNVRGMLIEENSFDMPLPSIVAGVHLKIGDGIHSIDHRTGRLPTMLGFDKATGVDFTLMASKTWQDPLLKRPLITSLGVRFTESSQIGWLGFGDDYKANLEANVAWVPTDWLAVAYEYRMKRDQYDTFKPLINGEDDWHTILVAWLINENMSLAAAYGHLGRIANTTEEAAWGIQFKYEF